MASTPSTLALSLASSSSSSSTLPPSVSSSSSCSSSSVVRRTCACYLGVEPSSENMAHFAGLGSATFVKALLCNFPVLNQLSVVNKVQHPEVVITVESINVLKTRKQCIVLVRKFFLPSAVCKPAVAALVVLIHNTAQVCCHANNEIAHILYFHPERQYLQVAAVNSAGYASNDSSTSGLCLVREYPLAHSVFGRLMDKRLLFCNTVLRTCPMPDCSSETIPSTINTTLALTQPYGNFTYFYAVSPPPRVSVEAITAINQDVGGVPTNTAHSYLCPPVAPLFVESVMAVTLLPKEVVHMIRAFYGCWWQ